MELEILYQDEAILVVNKPAGLATLPDGYDPSLPHIKSLLEQSVGKLWIVHRLDKGMPTRGRKVVRVSGWSNKFMSVPRLQKCVQRFIRTAD